MDIINSHSYIGSAVLDSKIPLIKTFYGYTLIWNRFSLSSLNMLLEETPQNLFAKERIAISKFCLSQMKHVSLKDGIFIPLGYSPVFKPEGKKIDLPKKSAVFVGRIEEYKGVDILIKMFNELKIKDAHLYIIGKKSCSQRYWSYLNKLFKYKNVHYLPNIGYKELPEYFRSAKVYAAATTWEGFGLPFIEAQACGIPAIGFNTSAIPETIIHKKTGFLANNKEEFIKYLRILLEDEEASKRMGKNGSKFVKDRFNWERISKQYLKVFEKCLKK